MELKSFYAQKWEQLLINSKNNKKCDDDNYNYC